MDVWGPYRVESFTRARYFLTIVDDFSKSTWVYLMREKNQVVYIVRKFLALVKNQYNVQVS